MLHCTIYVALHNNASLKTALGLHTSHAGPIQPRSRILGCWCSGEVILPLPSDRIAVSNPGIAMSKQAHASMLVVAASFWRESRDE
jgi:hypothetical protein